MEELNSTNGIYRSYAVGSREEQIEQCQGHIRDLQKEKDRITVLISLNNFTVVEIRALLDRYSKADRIINKHFDLIELIEIEEE